MLSGTTMHPEFVQQIVTDTLAAIVINLNKLTVPATQSQIELAFNEPIKAAYQALNNADNRLEDAKQLYKKLSLALHPDKLPVSKERLAIAFHPLVEHEKTLYNVPQQVLLANKDQISTLIDNITKESPGFLQFFLEHLVTLGINAWKSINRYNQPFKDIVFYFRAIFLTINIISFLLPLLITMGVNILNTLARKYLLSLVLTNHYHIELEKLVTTSRIVDSARKFLTNKGIYVSEESDEDVIKLYIAKKLDPNSSSPAEEQEEEALNKLKNEIKNNLNSGLKHFTIVLNAFKNALFEPFPSSLFNITLNILTRVIQAILMIPLLIVDISIEMVKHTLVTLLLGVMASCFAASMAIIVCSNLPLYLYDGLVSVFGWKNNAPDLAKTTTQDQPDFSTSATVLMLLKDAPPSITSEKMETTPSTRTSSPTSLSSQSMYRPASNNESDKDISHSYQP